MSSPPAGSTDTVESSTAEVRRAWQAFGLASVSLFMFVLDSGLLSVAMPEIERDFPTISRAAISWVSTGFLVTLAGLMLVAGRLGDVYGRKLIFRRGLIVLTAGSLLTAVAPNIGLLIASRMVQGVGAALVTATALTLVLNDIPENKRPLAMGVWGSVGSLAAVAGPTLGAEIVEATSWRFALALIAPLAAATWVFSGPMLKESSDPTATREIDPIGVLLACAGIGGLALGLSQSRIWGTWNIRTLAAVAVGVLAMAAFVQRCRVHENPVLRLRLLSNRQFSGPTIAAGLQQIGFFSWFFSTSFVLREIWGWSVRDTGRAISITFVFSAIAGVLGGRAAERWGYFWPTALSAVVAALGPLYWVATFDSDPSFWNVYLPGSMLFGLGGGVCGILTTGMALERVSDADQGMAYAAHQTSRRMASTFGLAMMAALLGEASGAALLGGARNVWLMSAGAHLAMILPLLPGRARSPHSTP